MYLKLKAQFVIDVTYILPQSKLYWVAGDDYECIFQAIKLLDNVIQRCVV